MAIGGFEKQVASRLGTNSSFTLTTVSQATAAFGTQTYQVRVGTNSSVTTCFVKVGDGTPTAGNTDAIMGANQIDYFCCTPGQKAAVVSIGPAAGTVSVTEMS